MRPGQAHVIGLPVYKAAGASAREFVEFWSAHYRYKLEPIYDKNIGKAPNPTRLRELFEWKNGGRLSDDKRRSVDRNFVKRLSELRDLSDTVPRENLLDKFAEGGAIWRVFFLHCWRPDRFPIFDQHVYRAMRFLQEGTIDEIPKMDNRKIEIYVSAYCPFLRTFADEPARETDRALWSFGKFIKAYPDNKLRVLARS